MTVKNCLLFDSERPGGGKEEYCVGVRGATLCKYILTLISIKPSVTTFSVNVNGPKHIKSPDS
jgi:hypothetical protein